ncbi:MAG: NAD-dependent epimerase/dehydratase family protein [Clostridia bacterium]|nr:NAD-dependent epimerase/dehydratase family protein [Clostridia bacterium]
MIRVLITGAGSYIGGQIAQSLPADSFDVREADVRNGLQADAFQGIDAVIHVAGIAHQKETRENAPLYDRVNRALAVETAAMAKAAGVRQFVFFSSMSVYGMTTGHITQDTEPAPNTCYGRSKWEAEKEITTLKDDSFQVAILRPPMIYGRGCRGNYPRLAALARKLPLFPRCGNQRSMLYIETLCAFVRHLLESGRGGLYFPQNSEYVNTSVLVSAVARCHGRRIALMPGFDRLLRLMSRHLGIAGKVFGSLTYDQNMSMDFASAGQIPFEETIRRTEGAR